MRTATTNRHGVSLVEVTLALGVASVCLVTIFGLLPVGLQANQNATQQGVAADILGAVSADLRATPATAPRGEATASPRFAINIPGRPIIGTITSTIFFSSDGQFSTSTNLQSRCRLTISFLPNIDSQAVMVDLKMTWPAEATPVNATGVAEMFLSLDRN